MTLAARRMASFTGAGSSTAPAARASLAWRASSSIMRCTMARDAWSAAGSRSRWLCRCCSDLAFGFGDETQADAWAQPAGEQPDAEGARVPQRVEQAGAVVQLLQPPSCPRQVVGLLARRRFELPLQRGIVGGQRLRVVQRLRADLADMVHAHQRGGQAALFLRQSVAWVIVGGRRWARRDIGAGQRAQRVVGAGQDLIHA